MSFFQPKKNKSSTSSHSDSSNTPFIGVQAKLKVNEPNDKFEQEADNVADKVVNRKSIPGSQPFFPASQSAQLSKEDAPEKEEAVQKKSIQETISPIQAKEETEEIQKEEDETVQQKSGDQAGDSSQLESNLRQSKGSGQPMDDTTRQNMESGIGADFSQVRIHNDASAVQMNKELGAKAFTNGNDIYFNEGNYDPSSKSGEHLLAHELTHTVQQGKSKPTIQKQDGETALERLDEMLNRFNVPEEDVIATCGLLNDTEKATVRTSPSYKRRMAASLNVSEMVRAVRQLGLTLEKQLEWVHAATFFGTLFLSYSEIKSLVQAAPTAEKNALKTSTTAGKSFFVGVCNNSTMVEALDDLQYDLITKLTWLKAEMTITSWELHYSTIKPWITHANTTQGERDALKTHTDVGRDFFIDVCTNATMVEALDDLQYDLNTKLTWLKAETIITSWELNYNTIKPWIVHPNTTQIERDALKTHADVGKDFFVAVCTNSTMVEALDDLQYDLITKLTWLKAEMTITAWELGYSTIKPWIIHANTTQVERDALKTHAEVGKDFFVDVCVNANIVEAVQDLQFDLKTKIEWVREEAELQEVKDVIELATQAERDLVWNDAAYLSTLRAAVGDNYYLWVISKLRMKFVGTVTHTSAIDADAAIQTHLSAYVATGVAAGRQIEGFVAIVDALNWRIAGVNHYGASVWATKNLAGFVDSEERVWISMNAGNIATMIHEGVHKYSVRVLIHESQPLNEGVTEYFTRLTANAAGINISTRNNYAGNYSTTVKLVALVGEATVASAYFDGDVDGLRDAFVAAKSAADWTSFLRATKRKNWSTADGYL